MSDSSPEEDAATTPTQPSTLQQYLPYWVTGYSAPQQQAPPAQDGEPEESGGEEDSTTLHNHQGGISIGLKKLGNFLGAYLGAYLGAPWP